MYIITNIKRVLLKNLINIFVNVLGVKYNIYYNNTMYKNKSWNK